VPYRSLKIVKTGVIRTLRCSSLFAFYSTMANIWLICQKSRNFYIPPVFSNLTWDDPIWIS